MAIIINSFSGLYKKTHVQNLYNITGRKLNHDEIGIMNLFQQRI